MAEAAVVGVPDDVFGEVAAAFVVRRAESTVTGDDLRRFCVHQVPSFKIPARITFLDALPRNEAGKILRRSLVASGAPNPERDLARSR